MVYAVRGVRTKRGLMRVRHLACTTAPGARLASAVPCLNVGRSRGPVAGGNFQQGHRRPVRNSARREVTDIDLSHGL